LIAAWPLMKLYLLFGGTLIFLFTFTMINPVVDHVLMPYNSFLAWSTAEVVSLLGSDHVISAGTTVTSAGFVFSIAEGCNGVYALAVVVAGMVSFPLSWRRKIIGLIIAVVFVMMLNYIRILSLWYAGESGSFLYEAMHTYLWEFIIIGAGAGFLYFWYEKSVKKS
jgi:exosortase H (IPTLxxWG-CTERM-specific)